MMRRSSLSLRCCRTMQQKHLLYGMKRMKRPGLQVQILHGRSHNPSTQIPCRLTQMILSTGLHHLGALQQDQNKNVCPFHTHAERLKYFISVINSWALANTTFVPREAVIGTAITNYCCDFPSERHLSNQYPKPRKSRCCLPRSFQLE